MERPDLGIYDEYLEDCTRLGLEFIRRSRRASQGKRATKLPQDESNKVKSSAKISPFFVNNANTGLDRSFSLSDRKPDKPSAKLQPLSTEKSQINIKRDNILSGNRKRDQIEKCQENVEETVEAEEKEPTRDIVPHTSYYQFDDTKGLKKILAFIVIVILFLVQFRVMLNSWYGTGNDDSGSTSQNLTDIKASSRAEQLLNALDGSDALSENNDNNGPLFDSQHAKRILQALDEGKPPRY